MHRGQQLYFGCVRLIDASDRPPFAAATAAARSHAAGCLRHLFHQASAWKLSLPKEFASHSANGARAVAPQSLSRKNEAYLQGAASHIGRCTLTRTRFASIDAASALGVCGSCSDNMLLPTIITQSCRRTL